MKIKPSRLQDKGPSRTKKLFLPLFLGAILVLSTFAIIFSGSQPSSTSSYKYKSIYFRLTSQGWESTLQGQPVILRNGPQELESLFTMFPLQETVSLLSLEKIYVSTYPGEAVQEAVRDLYLTSTLLPPLTFSCVEEVAGCEELPIKTCTDATVTQGVLIFRLGNITSLTRENDSCYTFVAENPTVLTQMTDKMIYYLYGVF